MATPTAKDRVGARSHQRLGFHGTASVEQLGQTSPGGYHLHYLNESYDDETVIWLDPADAPITGVVLGVGAGPQNDAAAIVNALEALAEIEAVLRRELAARIGVTAAEVTR